jgi:hypothetical protein
VRDLKGNPKRERGRLNVQNIAASSSRPVFKNELLKHARKKLQERLSFAIEFLTAGRRTNAILSLENHSMLLNPNCYFKS